MLFAIFSPLPPKDSSFGAVKVSARQILIEESVMVAATDVNSAANAFASDIDGIKAERKELLRNATQKLGPLSSVLASITPCLSNRL